MYFSARAEGRISYGHLGRTNSCFTCEVKIVPSFFSQKQCNMTVKTVSFNVYRRLRIVANYTRARINKQILTTIILTTTTINDINNGWISVFCAKPHVI